MNLFPWFLFAHILGAIIAFGAGFSAFPMIGAFSGREPAHANFGARISHAISEKIVRPFAILQGLTGIGLIWSANIDLTKALWLDVAIVIYLAALGFALFVLIPNGRRIVELSGGGPPPMAGGGMPGGMPGGGMPGGMPGGAATMPAGSGEPGGASGAPARPSGPPPELLAAVRTAQRGGMFLGIAITVIVFLMVVKPF